MSNHYARAAVESKGGVNGKGDSRGRCRRARAAGLWRFCAERDRRGNGRRASRPARKYARRQVADARL